MVKGHRVASRGLAARRRVILQANDAGPHLRRGSAWCGDVSPAHLSSSAGAAERDAQPVRVTRPVCGSMVNVAITEPSCGRQREPDRAVGPRRDVDHLPRVVAVPQQESLGDLLHVRRGQVAVLLVKHQREGARGDWPVPPLANGASSAMGP